MSKSCNDHGKLHLLKKTHLKFQHFTQIHRKTNIIYIT